MANPVAAAPKRTIVKLSANVISAFKAEGLNPKKQAGETSGFWIPSPQCVSHKLAKDTLFVYHMKWDGGELYYSALNAEGGFMFLGNGWESSADAANDCTKFVGKTILIGPHKASRAIGTLEEGAIRGRFTIAT